MKILYIHNSYAGNNSGEEHAAEGLAYLLTQNGHEVSWYRRSSDEIAQSKFGAVKAFFTGIYNPVAVAEIKRILEDFKPDLVQIQNIYPLISPAIFGMIKKMGIPIVMRCPNYRLFCPNGLHLDTKGKVCESCLGKGREWNGVSKNCESSRLKSTGYALRNFFARAFWKIQDDVDAFIVQSEFQKQKFIQNGIPEKKLFIVPGLTPSVPKNETKLGDLVSFVGRISPEKGIIEFLEAARNLPEITFAIAGGVDESFQGLVKSSPPNVQWKGYLKGNELDQFYQDSRIIVVPGKWYEGFPNVITRAMQHSKPVITSNLGAMASIIDHEINGLLVEPGHSSQLSTVIGRLYNNPELCKQFGKAGFLKAQENYSREIIYQNLLNVYSSLPIKVA
ncbi:glycosyltransferase family 4 protein [Algoriphagus aquatilis]|uniref:Glycosyltransferase family 4 protein n=1 Tax=Algoriphagus aquatilis TaxID=490186 RepID=A0ABW0BTR7_9BACT